jgi:hypothetical protein
VVSYSSAWLDYSDFFFAFCRYGDLKKECDKRGLKVQGGKEQLIKALVASS